MLAHLFDVQAAKSDPDNLASDQRDGARSVLTGLAAAKSADSGLPVDLKERKERDRQFGYQPEAVRMRAVS